MQRNEKIWIHEACSPSSCPQTLCKLFTFDEQSGKHLSTLCSWCSLCNKYHAACISSGAITPQNRQMAEDSLHFHWPANRAFRMFYNTKEKRATHSWVIVLHKGPGVCKASLRTDGYKPLWLYSPHRQTLNQVKHSEHRLHGKTRKLRVQILVSGRNRSGYPKPLAQNFPAQDQYISIIIVGLCVERAMPAPHSHEVKAGGGLAHWRNLKIEQVFIFKMPCAHSYQLATSIVFSCADDTASQEIKAKKEHHLIHWSD